MARFVDLDEEDSDAAPLAGAQQDVCRDDDVLEARHGPAAASDCCISDAGDRKRILDVGSLPQANGAVARAFQCYPIVISIVSSIDLNTLDALARASRSIHSGLIQYRTTLVAATLRCSYETLPVDQSETLRYRARAGNWFYMEDGRSYNGKAGHCARDMVGECRRCGEVVCRNCAIKPPAPAALRERHRRLCLSCARAPIATLSKPPLDDGVPLHADAMQRAVCKCATEGVWLCQPCGRSIRGADHEYRRIWRWRNHYGEVLGGLGTGIGDGDRGVICGREEDCCAAKEREQEIDCDAEDARDSSINPWTADLPFAPSSTTNVTNSSTPQGPSTPQQTVPLFASAAPIDALIDESRRTPSPQQLGPGYARHEIEGIGGVVKRKLVRMVRIGACVPEWEDERGSSAGQVLGREVRGKARSWCGWCWRVIPGEKDIHGGDESDDPAG